MFASTRLIGRTAELSQLDAQWDAMITGGLRFVLLLGEPGVGKTRLAEEALASRQASCTALSARAHPLSVTASFGLWGEAFERYLRDLNRDEVSRLCGGLLEDLASLLRSVAAARGAIPPGEPPRSRLVDSLGALLARLAVNRPVLIVLDDMHAADASSWDFLHSLASQLPSTQVLVILAARPGELTDEPVAMRVLLDLEQQGVLHRIDVRPLGDEAIRELAEDFLSEPVEQELLRWLTEHACGNPLFTVGLLQALREEGADLMQPTLRSLPEVIAERVRLRVAALGEVASDLLEVLAVFEGQAELGTFLSGSGLSLDEVAPPLRQLVRSRLVVEEQTGSKCTYDFAHPLIQQAIYEDIGAARRFVLHRQVGRALLVRGRMGEAALHFARSAEPGDDEAIEVLREALHQAEQRGAYREGLKLLGSLVSLVPSGDPRWIAVADSMSWEADWVVDHRADTDNRMAVAALREIDTLLAQSPDTERRAALKARLAGFLSWGLGELEAATDAAQEAVDLYELSEARTQARLMRLELAYLRAIRGDIPAMSITTLNVFTEAQAAGDDVAIEHALGALGLAAFYQGRFGDAEAAHRRSIDMSRDAGNLYRITRGLGVLGWSLGYEGRVAEALDAFAEAKAVNPAWRESIVLELEANVRWLAGDLHGSLTCAWDAVALNPGGLSLRRNMGLCFLGLAGAETDQLAEARRSVTVARRIYGRQRWYFLSDQFRHAEGVLAWRENRAAAALPLLGSAAEGLVRMGAPVLAAPVLVDLAEAGAEAGEAAAAEEAARRLQELAAAIERPLYRAMAELAESWAALARGQKARATELAQQTVGLLRGSGYRVLEGRSLLALASGLEASDPTAAVDALREAAAAFDASGATWRRDRVLEALRALGRTGRRAAAAAAGTSALTTRELQVAELAAKRISAQAIADLLFVSRRTVESHLDSIYTKLGVHSKAELVNRLAELSR